MAKSDCKKCGNPVVMFWCKVCETNGEYKECIDCGAETEVDAKYHDECDEFKRNQTLVIPVSESDIQDLQNGEEFHWTFTTDGGEEIDVHLRPEIESDIE
jgi:RecJ-like exonuclease